MGEILGPTSSTINVKPKTLSAPVCPFPLYDLFGDLLNLGLFLAIYLWSRERRKVAVEILNTEEEF